MAVIPKSQIRRYLQNKKVVLNEGSLESCL